MNEVQGKFILFDVSDFIPWLKSQSVSRVIQIVQNHHTFIPNYSHFSGDNHFHLLQTMENAHLERGFSEIAQNLTTFPDGTVAVCRSFDKIPAGIKGANTGAICLENLGNFDDGADVVTDSQRSAIIRVNALLCERFRIAADSANIVYHHWFDLSSGLRTNGTGTTKSCPGTGFFGGNSVESAEVRFIPLIQTELAAIGSTPIGLVTSPLFAGRIVADSLNVRAKSTASSKIVKQLARGTVVNVFKVKNSWCRIDPKKSHWVNGKFLERLDLSQLV